MDFVIGSDPHVAAALWCALAALGAAFILLVTILGVRVRLLHQMGRKRDVAAFWIPLIARCTDTRPATLPDLPRRDALEFLLLWCRAQDSLRGESCNRLREMARRLGADVHASRMLRSRSLRRRLIATVALGHFRMREHAAWLQAQVESEPLLPSLVAAKALVRMDASIGVPCILSITAHREEWPVASVATMLRECDGDFVGSALTSAIRDAISRTDDIAITRLLRLHVAAERGTVRNAVRDVLAACTNPEVLVAALAALEDPGDVAHARRLLGHPEWFVRVAASRALGRLGDENDVGRLIVALRDPSWWVRHRAAQALSQLPGMDTARLGDIAARQTDRYAADMLRQTLAERCAT